MHKSKNFAVIGAGMAGLAAAKILSSAGHNVTLFEKSRGVGGRMATRRVGDLQFDHGAQYFTAKSLQFQNLADSWIEAGHAQKWFDDALVGTPGMSAIGRAFSQGLNIKTGFQAQALHRDTNGWQVKSLQDQNLISVDGSFDSILLAIPLPQAIPLAATAGVVLPGVEFTTYAPCWALMLAYNQPVLTFDHQRADDGIIAWIARDASKPGRTPDSETIVIHATPEWSKAHLEEPTETVATALLNHFSDICGIHPAPVYVSAHRWRYALVEEPLGKPFIWDEALKLGACGDWCIGPRIEDAFESGNALAEAALKAWEVK